MRIASKFSKLCVSDHAVVRYLDRFENVGIDGICMRFGVTTDPMILHYWAQETGDSIDRVRELLADLVIRGGSIEDGEVIVSDIRLRIKNSTLVTVIATEPCVIFQRRFEKKIRKRTGRRREPIRLGGKAFYEDMREWV